ncbi:hypothetical protein [Streptomyces sp. A 4/2]|uniref:hypothetical protein n=1 Tax=Streptomyces sp. A 4/2 TaxID=2934314 RepID=UPI0020256DA1|nr:hypothetical protein [Streptomyces sp. A 4/2]
MQDVVVTNGDVEGPGVPLSREDAVAALGEAAQWWGCDVPDDPGAGELAELLDEVAVRLRDRQTDEQLRGAAKYLAEATEALGAVARLGGLLPVVSLCHLRTAVAKEQQARRGLPHTAIPHADAKTLPVAAS